MKKSQILAALALAFSLGVVAPVAGLVNNASAITITEQGVVATKKDLTDTIAAIEAQGEYQNYKALSKALAMSATDLSDDTLKTALVNAVKALDANDDFDYANYAGPTMTGTFSKAQALQATITEAEAAISKISGKAYNLWATLYTAMTRTNTNDPDHSDNQRAQAILDAATALGMNVAEYDATTDPLATVQGAINGTSYNTYASILGTIATDQTTVNNIDAKIAALKTALAPFANATAIADAAASATPITALSALQSTATRKSAYDTLINLVATDQNKLNTNATDLDESSEFITAIDALKSQYKIASGTDLVVSDSTATDPANPGATVRTLTSDNGEVTVTGAIEAGVKLVVAPAETNIFGDKSYEAYDITLEKDGKAYEFNGNAVVTIKLSKVDAAKSTVYYVDGDKAEALASNYSGSYISFNTTHFSLYAVVEGEETDDPSAPGTGLVSTAEGNAATTVSIVAGLATALTALGAGVVAYRSARRSEK